MPKTVPPGTITSAGQKFRVNVVPDVFDERDLLYRPRLLPLPPSLDARPDTRYVMTQVGNSCTGHALACMINTVLGGGPGRSHARRRPRPVRVSPYMLYRMARRYDEFQGDEDEGSSLRGALKGWYYQGVLPIEDWPRLDMDPEPDVDHDDRLFQLAMQRPLGAFYRVNPFRLDDVQSAVAELSCIVASALVHSGWEQPAEVQHGGAVLRVIERRDDVTPLGGHAFGIVGYNDVGLLIQNSWGEAWGAKGFATLPYDDWLASVYDAWVARPGVPMLVPERNRKQLVTTTTGVVAGGPGPDLQRLAGHVVNLDAFGLLAATGRFVSTPRQLDVLFDRMRRCHEQWRDSLARQGAAAPPPRRVVLYAHGGLDSERNGLDVAQEQLGWWLNNRVYPVTFAWQTEVLETLLDRLTDLVRGKVPFGVLGFDLVEQADRLVERFARDHLAWMWEGMRQNAAAASAPVEGGVEWPSDDGAPRRSLAALPGGSLFVDCLRRYVASVPEGERVEVHLAGHSAGSIFLAALLPRLQEHGLGVETMTWLAPALPVDDFGRLVLPHLRSGHVHRFASFGLSDQQELDDVCGSKGLVVYQKSLLYLVSRGLERGTPGERGAEVPLLGMKRCLGAPLDGSSVAETLRKVGAELVWSPSEHPAPSRCSATTHRGFDEDAATMTALLLRILGQRVPSSTSEFVPHAALLPEALQTPAENGARGQAPAEQAAATQVADVSPAGNAPVTRMAGPGPASGGGSSETV